MERAESGLAQAQREYAETEQAARYGRQAADAQAAELLARAHAWEERVAGETERVLREHAERREEVRRHLEHVRGSLTALSAGAGAGIGLGLGEADAGDAGDMGNVEGVADLGDAQPVPGPAPSAED
ncbi:hypothetical protein [Streptomyces sp. 7N604]|uniref:hypothetical protein n=1 Tax=Streptomyces sp. 7N604 TaxID=3457415 RepID=UPI003FD5AA79